jgi:hypothetical protein
VEYDGSKRYLWLIQIADRRQPDADYVVIHELMHVKTGLVDPAYEPWIHDVSLALARLYKNGGK